MTGLRPARCSSKAQTCTGRSGSSRASSSMRARKSALNRSWAAKSPRACADAVPDGGPPGAASIPSRVAVKPDGRADPLRDQTAGPQAAIGRWIIERVVKTLQAIGVEQGAGVEAAQITQPVNLVVPSDKNADPALRIPRHL